MSKADPIVTKQCPHCGATFETNSKRRVYCSPECGDAAARANIRAWQSARRVTTEPTKCAHCGADFTPRSKRQKFCCTRCAYDFHNAELRRRTAERLREEGNPDAAERARLRAERREEKYRQMAEDTEMRRVHVAEPAVTQPGYDRGRKPGTYVRVMRNKYEIVRTQIRS